MSDSKISALPAAAVLTGAELVPVVQAGNSVRTTAAALAGVSSAVNVLSYGADPSGLIDSTAAFSAAAQAAPAGVNSQGGIGGVGITFAPNATVLVPPGTYTLSSLVNTNGVDITWVLADDALIANYQFLNGRLLREGRRTNRATYGIGDFAAGFSVRANAPQGSFVNLEGAAEVMGFTAASQIGAYATRDSVGFYVSNTAVAPFATIANAGTTYTATSIAFTGALTAAQIAQMRTGMIINTQHGGVFYSGFITAWAANSITVSAWYASNNSGPATPANGTGAYVNPITKVWAHNANVTIPAGSIATAATGFELGTLNNLSNPGGPGGAPLVWGYDAVNLGTFPCEVGHLSRGGTAGYYFGFKSTGNGTGFYSTNDSVGVNINSLSGAAGIQTTGNWAAATAGISLAATMNGGTTVNAITSNTTYGNGVTANAIGFIDAPTLAPGTVVSNVRHFQASSISFGAGASATNQTGFHCSALTGATNNTGFLSQVAAGAGNLAFWASGTAGSLFGGPVNFQGAAAAVASGIALGGTVQTTVGATGVASALPANPLGYLIAFVAGAKVAIPYYTG